MQPGSGRSGFSTTTVRRRSASGSTPPAHTYCWRSSGSRRELRLERGCGPRTGPVFTATAAPKMVAARDDGSRYCCSTVSCSSPTSWIWCRVTAWWSIWWARALTSTCSISVFPAPRTRGCRSRTWSWTTYRVRSGRFSKPLTPPRSASSVILRAARCRPCTPPCFPRVLSRTSSSSPRPRSSRPETLVLSVSGRVRPATAGRSLTRLFGGAYDAILRKAQGLATREVSMRSWLAVCKWVDDAAPFPGETFRRWVKDFYQRDQLVKGRVELRGNRVDLSNITCAVLNVSGKWDYVVPSSQTKATTALAQSTDKESVSLDAGHVGMLVGPAAAASVWPLVRKWLAPRSGQIA